MSECNCPSCQEAAANANVVSMLDRLLDRLFASCRNCRGFPPARMGHDLYINDCCIREATRLVRQYGGQGYSIIECYTVDHRTGAMTMRPRIDL